MIGIVFGTIFGIPKSAWAACLNSYQTQTIAAAYEGDEEPTVHTIEACGGDDVSYQIPIATTINFDGVEYNSVYATTNSVITFGQPDGTYWDYPQTPSISLYSMDWVIYPNSRSDEYMIINYSEGGFQIDMSLRPIWLQSQPDPVNIVINAAITNTGGLAISYSTAFPATGVTEDYAHLRTGVRLHNGDVVSLESAGFYEVQDPQTLTLSAEPVDAETYVPGEPQATPEPTPEPATPEEIQAQVVEATQLANDIANINNLLIQAAESSDNIEVIEPEITEPEIIDPEVVEPEIVEPEVIDPIEPDVVVEPEIITPEDPRFPDDIEEQTPEDPATKPEDSEIIEEPSENEEPLPEPESPEEDTDESPIVEPETPLPIEDPVEIPDNSPPINNNTGSAISEEELNKLNKLIAQNDAKLLGQLTDTQKEEVAEALGIQAEEILIIAELAESSPAVAKALESFAEKLEENQDAFAPYTLADAITEENVEMFLENPIGALTNIDLDTVLNPSEWGKDMTDDQREKLQEIVIPVIIASNIIAASMTRRIG